MAIAVTMSGEVTKPWVAGLASFLPVKFLFLPMQGPQAFAKTNPPNSLKIFEMPSRSMVALICSDPGVITNCDFALRPLSRACLAIEAARVMSSGHPFFLAFSPILSMREARSGVNGPLMCGWSVSRLISIIWS
ncbi:hypothetical protein WR25_12837 [Diploscapter pachys]|uniref:Uncharacterized protein n=1 Tax=Diploscapter pachys TaxID=2018661 RepID=A0A2A2JBV7_9BILA|nr:hypothetical protein WR25_12837 [Diploscapter pachys]